MYNKSKKSEVSTRIKKVLVAVAAAKAAPADAAPAALAAVDALLGEAYKAIAKACSKGVLKKNTAGRRLSLVARAKNTLAVAGAAPAAA